VYLLLALAGLTLYVWQHVYTGREQRAVDHMFAVVKTDRAELDRLTARRDSLLSLSVIEPSAMKLGLRPPQLEQMARLPLDAPPVFDVPLPPEPPTLAGAFTRVWKWLDPPTVTPTEALARP
jgi:hypothetical protein